jgi:hypothetical protein
MPIRKVKGGYKWGDSGKVYPTRKGAEKQAAAAYASGYKKMNEGGFMKQVPEGNKGLKKLPKEVRNKMGYMKDGGFVGQTCDGCTSRGNCLAAGKCLGKDK